MLCGLALALAGLLDARADMAARPTRAFIRGALVGGASAPAGHVVVSRLAPGLGT